MNEGRDRRSDMGEYLPTCFSTDFVYPWPNLSIIHFPPGSQVDSFGGLEKFHNLVVGFRQHVKELLPAACGIIFHQVSHSLNIEAIRVADTTKMQQERIHAISSEPEGVHSV